MFSLETKNLRVNVGEKEILKGINLQIKPGQVHVLMGPNGSGKSSLAFALMGHPRYALQSGEIFSQGKKINDLSVDARAKLGIFLAFQNPLEITGVSLTNFLRTALNSVKAEKTSVLSFRKRLLQNAKLLNIPDTFLERYLNEGFSGGEKKKFETLQMLTLKPKLIILDEPDSGLDVDALKTVAKAVASLISPQVSVLLITHYQRILNYLKPHQVHLMHDGQIVKEGGPELVNEVEKKGFESIGVDL